MARRGLRALGVLLPLVWILVGGGTAPAEAHAYLESSNPVDGADLASAPAELRLSFSEHVVGEATRITVVDSSGRSVHLTGVRLLTRDAADTETPSTVVASWPRLAQGAYRVSWETLSSDDLHRTAGVLVFGIGQHVRATAQSEPMPRVDEITLRAGLLLALALAMGGALAERVLRRARARSPIARRLALVGGGATLVLSALLLGSQLAHAGTSVSSVLLGGYGVRWALRTVALVVLFVGLRAPVAPRRAALLLVGAAATCLATASLGHAGAGAFRPTRLLADAAHLAATLTWAGAVICLAVGLLVHRSPGEGPALRRALHAFAVPAAACLSVAAVTGLYLSSTVVGSVDAALLTFYGRTLLGKLLVVGAAAGLGLVNHLRLRHDPVDRLPRHTVPTEAAAIVGVVLLTAVLISGQPATEPGLVRPTHAADAGPVNRQVEDLQIAAGLRPNRVGRSVVVVDVFDTRRPSPAPITGVEVSVGAAPAVVTTSIGDGHWSSPVAVTSPGRTALLVTVHREHLPDVTGRFGWTVDPGVVPRPVLVSQAPLGPWLRGAAVLGVLLLLLGWSVAGVRAVRALRARRRVQPELLLEAPPRTPELQHH